MILELTPTHPFTESIQSLNKTIKKKMAIIVSFALDVLSQPQSFITVYVTVQSHCVQGTSWLMAGTDSD